MCLCVCVSVKSGTCANNYAQVMLEIFSIRSSYTNIINHNVDPIDTFEDILERIVCRPMTLSINDPNYFKIKLLCIIGK